MLTRPNATPSESLDYVERVNCAIDHIVRNLAEPLPLDTVAQVACFSPFHFHRVFRSLVGETLAQFVKRLRLERALYMLSHDRPRPLTEIALRCGFASSSDFSRSFKNRYGTPPSAFDLTAFREQRRQDMVDAVCTPATRYLLERVPVDHNPDGFEVQLRQLPARHVAYLRVLNPYREGVVGDAAARLVAWAEDRGLANHQWLGYMWDDPEIVAHRDCRYDVAVEVGVGGDGEGIEAAGEVGALEFPEMLVAQIEVRGAIDVEMRAIDWLFGTWLPNSGYVPTDQPSFEAWIGRPFAHGQQHFELHAQLPITRMGSSR